MTAAQGKRGWVLKIFGTRAHEAAITQSHGLRDAEQSVRDWLALTGHPDALTAELVWTYDVGDEMAIRDLKSARALARKADEMRHRAGLQLQAAVAQLAGCGLKGSDIAIVTGVSKQRVSQLLATYYSPDRIAARAEQETAFLLRSQANRSRLEASIASMRRTQPAGAQQASSAVISRSIERRCEDS